MYVSFSSFCIKLTDYYQGLRVEWAEGLVRVRSWEDEIALRLEEMQRSISTLLYDARVWRSRIRSRTTLPMRTCRKSGSQAARELLISEGIVFGTFELDACH